MNPRGITIIGAGAGTGKTHRLTEEVTRAIDPRGDQRLAVESLVAVTFTRRAHAELAARIRRHLVRRGAPSAALELPLALVGTVHSVALRLVQEHALELGLSPELEVLTDDGQDRLAQSLEAELAEEVILDLDRLSRAFQLRWDGQRRRHDWLGPVSEIMDLARANRIGPDALLAMGERSAAELIGLLPRAASETSDLDAALVSAIDDAYARLVGVSDGKGNTRQAIEEIEAARRLALDAELTWPAWASLAALRPSKACDGAVADLRSTAALHLAHPRFHSDLRALIRRVYEAASSGLAAYAAWKERRRAVDYVDMLDRCLDLLQRRDVRARLAGRLKLIAVDELQDTSPLQLALFMELHAICGRSVWVGDRKQCIFEYAGADPSLMDEVSRWVESAGGARARLRSNHRSRAELVEACSELFAAALAGHGFDREEVVLDAARGPMLSTSPFGLWTVEARTKQEEASAVASGVRRLLDEADDWKVSDRATGALRSLRPGDIAVLVATNEGGRRLAAALHAVGLRPALARAGLLSTPEGTLVDAALRWILDTSDALAAAVLDALTGFDGGDPDQWLAARIASQAHRSPGDGREPFGSEAWRAPLSALRERLWVLAPSEALDAVIAELDLVHLSARWPDPPQRIANVDALRALAKRYEARCAIEREAGSVGGLLRFFDDARQERPSRGEWLARDDQHVTGDDGSVVISTYHKAKGLEWPVVVLTDLDRGERRTAFDVTPVSDQLAFDPLRPLEGRWIRYWPWPHGQRKQTELTTLAALTEHGRAVAQREQRERIRLLYVGFTRARDHLVMTARVGRGGPRITWLDELADDVGPLLELPFDAGEGEAQANIRTSRGRHSVPTRVLHLAPGMPGPTIAAATPRWLDRPPAQAASRPSYRIAPSTAEEDVDARVARVARLHSGLALPRRGYDHDVLGDALHAFLAADLEGLTLGIRTARAVRIRDGFGLGGVLRAEDMLAVSDALRTWVTARWPHAVWHREHPVEALVASEHGARRIAGTVDLLLETPDGLAIIDHKTFPASAESAWRKKCGTFAPQLALYAAAVAQATHRPIVGCWIHLPVGGGMVELRLDLPPTS